MKTVQSLTMIFCCLAFSLAHAQNNAVQKVITNATTGKTPSISLGTISKNLDNGLTFTVTRCIGDPASQRVTMYFTISNPSKPNQALVIGDPYNNNNLTALDADSRNYGCASITLADQTGEGSYYFISMTKELPSGLSIKGNAVFTNVLPSVSSFAVVNLYEKSYNWEGAGDLKEGFIELRNIPIDWSNSNPASTFNTNTAQPPTGDVNQIKNKNNGINFEITSCIGDSQSQRVTLYFKFSNPAKANQQIQVADPYNHYVVNALDADSKPYYGQKITLADRYGEGPYAMAVAQLPTGLSLNGSVTFTNILPGLSSFALINLYEISANLDGGGDQASGVIELRNVPITWVKKPKPAKPH